MVRFTGRFVLPGGFGPRCLSFILLNSGGCHLSIAVYSAIVMVLLFSWPMNFFVDAGRQSTFYSSTILLRLIHVKVVTVLVSSVEHC